MLKAFLRTRGGARAFVLFALSVLMACFALPHHSHVATAAPSGGETTSTTAGTAAPSAPHADPDSTSAGGDCEQDSHPEPACHNTDAQVMDLAKRWSAAGSDDLTGLLGAVVVVLAGGALLLARARAQRCRTRPPRRLAGFPLLIDLGVSRT